jgi:hypothetical protein
MASKTFDDMHSSSFGVGIDAMVLYYKKRQWYTSTHDDDNNKSQNGDRDANSYTASTYASEAKTGY